MSGLSNSWRSRRLVVLFALLGIGLVAFGVNETLGAFSSSTGTTASITAKRIFTGTRTAGAHDLRDAADASEANASDILGFDDGLVGTSGSFGTSYAANRYVDLFFESPLPAGVPVSGVTFDYTMAASSAGITACYYIQVIRVSTGTVLETVPSNAPAANAACNSTTTPALTQTSVPSVTTSDIANDVKIRVFGKSTTASGHKIDRFSLSGTLYGSSFTIMEKSATDQSTGTPAAPYPWSIGTAADGAAYTSGAWASTYSTLRYLKLTFPGGVPAGATVTGATFTYSYRPSTNLDNACWYFEVYSSTTLLATHGSSGVGGQISCNTSSSTYVTNAVALPEIDTVAEANSVVIKVYFKNSGSRAVVTDLGTLGVTYSLD